MDPLTQAIVFLLKQTRKIGDNYAAAEAQRYLDVLDPQPPPEPPAA
jgi:hypothetical protein